MIEIAVIHGNTGPRRYGEDVARWIYALGRKRHDACFELVDINAFDLEKGPATRQWGSTVDPRKRWVDKMATFDAYLFVAPEHDHGRPEVMMNALELLTHEGATKACAFVAYGSGDGTHMVDQLRTAVTARGMAVIPKQVGLSLFSDFERFAELNPGPSREHEVSAMMDQLTSWGMALKTVRAEQTRKPRLPLLGSVTDRIQAALVREAVGHFHQ